MLMGLLARTVATVMLIILSPLFLLISCISLALQGYPVFFRQKRIGFNYFPFTFYKFRTMVNHNGGNKITDSKDMRITPWGNVLRAFKLDELPQLWNIVKGDIHFVGYRPEVSEIVTSYPQYFLFLTNSKPGITDISSIIFKNEFQVIDSDNPIESYTSRILPVKSNLVDLYIKKESTLLRLVIIIFTVISIFSHKMALKLVSYLIPRKDLELRKSINKLLKVDFF